MVDVIEAVPGDDQLVGWYAQIDAFCTRGYLRRGAPLPQAAGSGTRFGA